MSHPSYAKGYRLEKRVQALLSQIGECTRSMMSRGADLTLRAAMRLWSVSCKSRAKGKLTYRMIKAELETHDICATAEDYDPFPMLHIYAPKFIELVGKAAAEDETYYLHPPIGR